MAQKAFQSQDSGKWYTVDPETGASKIISEEEAKAINGQTSISNNTDTSNKPLTIKQKKEIARTKILPGAGRDTIQNWLYSLEGVSADVKKKLLEQALVNLAEAGITNYDNLTAEQIKTLNRELGAVGTAYLTHHTIPDGSLTAVTKGIKQPTDTQPTNVQPTDTQPTNVQPTNTQPTNVQPTNTQTKVQPKVQSTDWGLSDNAKKWRSTKEGRRISGQLWHQLRQTGKYKSNQEITAAWAKLLNETVLPENANKQKLRDLQASYGISDISGSFRRDKGLANDLNAHHTSWGNEYLKEQGL